MPSPFPGMDPFLEHPSLFPDLHGSLCIYLREAIQPKLPPSYFAVIGERLFVETSQRYVDPDVHVSARTEAGDRSARGGAGVLDYAGTQPILIEVEHDEQTESFVEIRTGGRGGKERIVTAIEILSIANKTPGAKGRDLYLRKQEEMKEADVHLVEIDLLRAGEHVTAVPLHKLRRRAGAFDYHICVRLADRLGDCLVYTNRLDEPLPSIAIPLLPGDGSVTVDMQAVFNRCYDAGPYRRRIDYPGSLPQPPLDAKRTRWMKQLIKKSKPKGSA